jgi:hypothetical protein
MIEADAGTSTNTFLSRAWTSLLVAGLGALVLMQGVIPALSAITADFPGYLTAARIVVDGEDTQRLYDDNWFRQQASHYGLESADNPAKFAPFPPPTALLLVPLARCQPLTALRIVTAVSVLCLVGSILLLARIGAWQPLDSGAFILLSALGVASGLRLGQPYILVATCCLLGYRLYLQGRPWLAGICFGLFVPVKYFPVIILAAFALQKEWKVLLGGVAAIAAIALVSVGVLGWQVHQIFLLSVLGNHLAAHLSVTHQSMPFTAVYQSFDTLFARLFVPDPALNPRPLLAAPWLRIPAVLVAKGSMVCLAAAVLVKLARQGSANMAAPSSGILGILVLLIAPATATYTCVLLWLPVALLVDYFLAKGARGAAYFVLVSYALLGFIPYGQAYAFEGRGGLTVLAYPRLLLLFVMFVGCACAIVRLQPRSASALPPASGQHAAAVAS